MNKFIGNFLLVTTFFGVFVISAVTATPCVLRPYRTGLVCVCNTTYCDTLEFETPKENGSFVVVSTSENGLRFMKTEGKFNTEKTVIEENISNNRHYRSTPKKIPNVIDSRTLMTWLRDTYADANPNKNSIDVTIKIDHAIKHQKIIGFGGALTGSVAHLLQEMDEKLKDNVLNSYFSKQTGIGYTMIRTSIGGCDFDLVPWAYNEFPKHDSALSNFTKLDERDLLKVKLINEVKRIAEDDKIKIMATAWSSPKWMKEFSQNRRSLFREVKIMRRTRFIDSEKKIARTNEAWTGPSALRSVYYSTWADYHLKFLELMQKENVSIWAISTGNEPMNGAVWWMIVKFMSLGWSPKEQGIWVAKYLGPKLKESNFRDVLLFAGDDQRYTFPWWFDEMTKGDNNSLNFIDGFAVHWYWDAFIPPTSTIDKTSRLFPEKLILNTESCLGDKPLEHHGPILGSWGRAIAYITNIIQDLQHSINGWIDWNLILNEQGGPNYAKNYVEAPMVKNNTIDEIYKQPIFYVLGHFSRFVIPESIRVHSSSSDKNIGVLAFDRPDGLTSVILYNSYNSPVTVKVEDNEKGRQEFFLPPHSIHSLLYS